ncbi:MAG: ABC transporter permease [Alphaproteobacteria bacterium]
MNFVWYLIARIGGALVTCCVGAFIIFMVMQFAPGDPAVAALGENATAETIAIFRKDHGLDLPLHVQFFSWAGGVLTGDLGRSIAVGAGYPIWDLLGQRIPNTITIAVFALILAIVVGIAAGTVAALHQGKTIDTAATSGAVLGISMPDFWLSYVLVLIFAIWLKWLPAYGFVNPSESFLGTLTTGILPAAAIGAPMAGVFARILRAALLETKRRDYVTAARSYGFSYNFIYVHYIFRNALIPFVTVIGLQARYLVGGTVIIERIFGVSGLGTLMIDSALGRDYPVVQACTLTFLVVVLLVNLAVDIVCALLDPRRTH